MTPGLTINAPLTAPNPNSLPGPYGAEQLQLEQKQALANALMSQSLSPVQANPAGRLVAKVSPFQVAAQLGQAYLGKKVQGDVTDSTLDLSKRYLQNQQDAWGTTLGGGDKPPITQTQRIAYALKGETPPSAVPPASAAPTPMTGNDLLSGSDADFKTIGNRFSSAPDDVKIDEHGNAVLSSPVMATADTMPKPVPTVGPVAQVSTQQPTAQPNGYETLNDVQRALMAHAARMGVSPQVAAGDPYWKARLEQASKIQEMLAGKSVPQTPENFAYMNRLQALQNAGQGSGAEAMQIKALLNHAAGGGIHISQKGDIVNTDLTGGEPKATFMGQTPLNGIFINPGVNGGPPTTGVVPGYNEAEANREAQITGAREAARLGATNPRETVMVETPEGQQRPVTKQQLVDQAAGVGNASPRTPPAPVPPGAGGAAVPGANGPGAGGFGPTISGREYQKVQVEREKNEEDTINKQAEAGVGMQRILTTMQKALGPDGQPNFTSGAGLELRYDIARMAQGFGVPASITDKFAQTGDVELFKKLSMQLGTEMMHSISSRGGTQMEWARTLAEGIPSMFQTPGGLQRVMSSFAEGAQLLQAKQQAYNAFKASHGPGQRDTFENEWNTQLMQRFQGEAKGAKYADNPSKAPGAQPPVQQAPAQQAPQAGSAHDELPPASQHKGSTATDSQTGQQFKSDGNTWIRTK